RMVSVDPRYRLVVGRLELVIELLADPLPDLDRDRAGIDPGGDRAQQLEAESQVLHVGVDRLRDPGVLDLDRDLLVAAPERRPMDLADRRRRNRDLVEVAEVLLELALEVL